MGMKTIFATATIAIGLLSVSSVSYAEDVVLCSGKPGGGYDSLMKEIGNELSRQGHSVQILNLNGSEDIINHLNAGKCHYGPAQKDIHYRKFKQDSSVTSSVVPRSPLYTEALTLVCSKNSRYDELSDIREGDTVIVDTIGSGSALTWETLVAIEKEFGNGSSWSKAIPEYTPLDEAAGALELGVAKCAFGVGKVPINWASDIEKQGGRISWIYDKDINDLEYNGGPLYDYLYVKRGAYTSKFETYGISAILFRSNKLPKLNEVDAIVGRIAPSFGSKRNTVK